MGQYDAPQRRTKPRLKQFLIRCDWCGHQMIRYYPARERVRSKLSPFRFCSPQHARLHWERRRREERKAAVEPYQCHYCFEDFMPEYRPGRPRDYCCDEHKQAAARERARRAASASVIHARAVAAKMRERATVAEQAAAAYRAGLTRWRAGLEQAQREVLANPKEKTLRREALEQLAAYEEQQARLDATAARAAAVAAAADDDVRLAEDRAGRRAAAARQRRAREREAAAAAAPPTVAAPSPPAPRAAYDSERADG